jgi:hypothetical protein
MHIAERSIQRLLQQYRKQDEAGSTTIVFPNERKSKCGQKSKLTPQVRAAYHEVIKEYAHSLTLSRAE